MSFRDWSIWRLLLISIAWVVVSVAAIHWKTNRLLEEVIANDPQQRGVAAITTPLSLPSRIVLGPPVLLMMVWLLFKWKPA